MFIIRYGDMLYNFDSEQKRIARGKGARDGKMKVTLTGLIILRLDHHQPFPSPFSFYEHHQFLLNHLLVLVSKRRPREKRMEPPPDGSRPNESTSSKRIPRSITHR